MPANLASADEEQVPTTTSLATLATAVDEASSDAMASGSSQISGQEIYEAVEQQLLEMENLDEFLAQLEESLATGEAPKERVLVLIGDVRRGDAITAAIVGYVDLRW